MNFKLRVCVLCSLLVSLFVSVTPSAWGEEKSPHARWERDIQAYEAADKTSPPPADAVLFVGASGIKLWKSLATDFPEYKVINRGFGGSQLGDSVFFADRIVIPYKPRVIVLNAGGNDINSGATPEKVAANFEAFVEKVQAKLPLTRIVFHSLTPSPARWTQADKQRKANQLIKDHVAKCKNVMFVDLFDAFLGTDGQPRAELFVADRLHHNEEGYKMRANVIRPFLRPE